MGERKDQKNNKTAGAKTKDLVNLFTRIFLFSRTVNISFLIVMILTISLQFTSFKIRPNETALYYFFSSIAQSMAAIIALVGTVAIFRYSFLVDKLKRIRETIKEKFATNAWLYFSGWANSRSWHDEEVLVYLEEFLKNERLPAPIRNDANVCMIELKSDQVSINNYRASLRNHTISTFFTFLFSLVFIPLSEWIVDIGIGIYLIDIFVFLVLNTILNLYKYFVAIASSESRSVR